jgi:hypothetical protein
VAALATLAAHDRISTKVTWDREIAPIVRARCVSCHSSGGKGPMPLTTYDEVRPWARAIKEEVLTRRMPKWHVVRGYGDFTNDPSLSPFEIGLIAAWVDGGAPSTRPAAPGPTAAAGDAAPAASPAPARVRAVTLPCSTRTLPPGRLLGLKPALQPGGSLRLTLRTADGLEEPVLWIRDFDPKFAETYWLRNPVAITRGAAVVAEFSGACTLTSLFAAGTVR